MYVRVYISLYSFVVHHFIVSVVDRNENENKVTDQV